MHTVVTYQLCSHHELVNVLLEGLPSVVGSPVVQHDYTEPSLCPLHGVAEGVGEAVFHQLQSRRQGGRKKETRDNDVMCNHHTKSEMGC